MSRYSNVINENGEQFIPASQRPDGTWRKARRVKDGYVPQEEVPLYESKGKQFMSKKPEPIILPGGKIAQRPIPGLCIVQDEKEKKPSKKKDRKKITEVTNQLENFKISTNNPNEDNKCNENPSGNSNKETTDPAKKLKNLKKKLREIESLEEKLKNGTVTKPEPEQLAKIKRKNDLLVQINELEKHAQQ